MKIKKILMVIVGTFLAAFAFTYLLVPYDVVTGGVSGISQIVNEYIHINKSIFILVLSVLLLFISLFTLGKEKTINSVLGSILFPIFTYITEELYIFHHFDIENGLLAAIFGGLILGIGLGIVYREDYTTGGMDIVDQIFGEYLHISRGLSKLILEMVMLIITILTFGFNNFMYSIIAIYLSSMMIDRIMIGISNSKSFYIITKKPNEVKDFIINTLKHGVTILDSKGAYSNTKNDILLTVIPTRDYYKLKEGLRIIDRDAFFIVNDSYEVKGGK